MKKCLITIITVVLIAAAFVALGASTENPMLGFGLVLTMAAGMVTIGLAVSGRVTAMRTQFEPTEEPEQKESHTFTHLHRMMGVDSQSSETLRLVRDLAASVEALEQKVLSLEFDRRMIKTNLRICFDNIRYHEEITLPQALAASWGGTVLSTVVGLTGAVIAAFPQSAFEYARSAYVWTASLF